MVSILRRLEISSFPTHCTCNKTCDSALSFCCSATGRPVLSPSLDEIQDTLLQPLKDTLTAISPLPSSAKSVSQLPESHGVAASGDMSESDGKAEPNDSTSPSRLSPLASAYLHSRLSAEYVETHFLCLVP